MEYINFEKVLSELGIVRGQIFDYLTKGLNPYYEDTLAPIPCPREYHLSYWILNRKMKFRGLVRKDLMTLKKIATEIGNGDRKSFSVGRDSDIYNCLKYNGLSVRDGQIEVDKKNVHKIKWIIKQQKQEFDQEFEANGNELREMQKKDPEFKSWRYFQIPETKDDISIEPTHKLT